MEKKNPDVDFREDDNDHDVSPRSSKVDDGNEKVDSQAVNKSEEDDPTTDYSSKAATKTSLKDYLVQTQLLTMYIHDAYRFNSEFLRILHPGIGY